MLEKPFIFLCCFWIIKLATVGNFDKVSFMTVRRAYLIKLLYVTLKCHHENTPIYIVILTPLYPTFI